MADLRLPVLNQRTADWVGRVMISITGVIAMLSLMGVAIW